MNVDIKLDAKDNKLEPFIDPSAKPMIHLSSGDYSFIQRIFNYIKSFGHNTAKQWHRYAVIDAPTLGQGACTFTTHLATEAAVRASATFQHLHQDGNIKRQAKNWKTKLYTGVLLQWAKASQPGSPSAQLATLEAVPNSVTKAFQEAETNPSRKAYKGLILALRTLAESAGVNHKAFAGEAYHALIHFAGTHQLAQADIFKETLGIDLEHAVNEATDASTALQAVHAQAQDKIGRLRGIANWRSKITTLFHRIMNNLGRFDQIRAGNLPYLLGTVTLASGKRVQNIRHGSPIDQRGPGRTPQVTPEFNAWVASLEAGEGGLLYISRMHNTGAETAKNAAIKAAADASEGKMTTVILPGDGHYYEQKGEEFAADQTFANFSADLLARIDSNQGSFFIPTDLRTKLVDKFSPEDEEAHSFKKILKVMLSESTGLYNRTLLDPSKNLSREERRAILVNFINGTLTEALLEAAQPQIYINSCKENVDRGAVGNAISAFRLTPPEDGAAATETMAHCKQRTKNLLLAQFTAVLTSKKRSVNHNISNTSLWLKHASPEYLTAAHPTMSFSLAEY